MSEATQLRSMLGTVPQDRLLFCAICAMVAIAAAVGLLSLVS